MINRIIQLQANEVLVSGTKHTLIGESQDWNYFEYVVSPRKHQITVYYKQSPMAFLYKRSYGFVERDDPSKKYANLQEVIDAYRDDVCVSFRDQENERKGIVQWCERGPVIARITVALSHEEMDTLQRLAQYYGCDMGSLVVQSVKTVLQTSSLAPGVR